MIAHALRLALSLLALCALMAAGAARADDASKEACIDAHSRGQDARQQGKLSVGRKLFLACAQPQCPALVQDDCARFADELDRMQPWLSFAARDDQGNDLPDTAVYVDDQLLLTRLDDGEPHALDPGRHVVRFSHAGRDQIATVVVGTGEKGRTIVASFAAAASARGTRPAQPAPAELPETRHAAGARALVIGSAALLAAGAAVGIVGLARVPSSCSLASHDCAAPPGDDAFDEAEQAVRLSNAGWTCAGVGAAALVGGLVWFFKSAKPKQRDGEVLPYVTPNSAGLSVRGRL